MISFKEKLDVKRGAEQLDEAKGDSAFIITSNNSAYLFVNGKRRMKIQLEKWLGAFAVRSDSHVKRKIKELTKQQ